MPTERGIYFELATAPGHAAHGYYHAYLVYRDGVGKTEVIRGGPRVLGFSSIEVESGIPLIKSEDAYEPGETMESRQAQKLDLGGRDPVVVWSKMKETADGIGKAEIDYDFMPDQNSNSMMRSVLDSADIPFEKAIPSGVKVGDLPGIKNDLSKHLPSAREKKPGIGEEEVLSVPKDTTKEVPGRQGALSGPADPGIDAFLAELKKPLDREDEFLLKPVAQISQSEMKRVMA
ncbi:MAG: hypothetical protein HOJ02_01435, partial [Rhodospirillaceae bacterium]|nr:hypothetical protein [Rhodospirillaceae bacterium]